MAEPRRPHLLVAVAGTGTEIGKTWVTAAVAAALRDRGRTVGARKPAQSFETDDGATDAHLLGAATGEDPHIVCPPHRWYPVPMAPPMAAAVLGRPALHIATLRDEISGSWPPRADDIGFVELAGGAASPLASDGDAAALTAAIDPDMVVLVADAALGTINAVRLSVGWLQRAIAAPIHVHLNRYDNADPLHAANRDWLRFQDGLSVTDSVGGLAQAVLAAAPTFDPYTGLRRAGGTGDADTLLEPPRFCPVCGRRVAVVVTPRSVRARCRLHGEF